MSGLRRLAELARDVSYGKRATVRVDHAELLALLDERDRLRTALREIEQHHVRINAEAGRPAEQSHTIARAREALGEA